MQYLWYDMSLFTNFSWQTGGFSFDRFLNVRNYTSSGNAVQKCCQARYAALCLLRAFSSSTLCKRVDELNAIKVLGGGGPPPQSISSLLFIPASAKKRDHTDTTQGGLSVRHGLVGSAHWPDPVDQASRVRFRWPSFPGLGPCQIFSIFTAQALYSAVLVIGSMAGLVSQLALLSRK